MNRLWVRFSLVTAGSILLVLALPAIVQWTIARGVLFASLELAEAPPPEIQALLQDIPPETVARIREVAQEELSFFWGRLLIIASLIGALGGALVSRTLTAPLQKLEKGAQAIAERDLSHRVVVHGTQETESLARSFNQMAAQLETAEKQRQNLLTDVAHELRHPIHILQGNLQAILDDVYPLNKEEIARLFDQTRHLATLVNDLHELAQAEAKQLPLHKQWVDIGKLVKETAVSFRPIAQAKSVQIKIELLGAMPAIAVDANRIRQIINNLLTNALRHTPADGLIQVQVETGDSTIQIQIADNGSGIATADLPHLFDRFYRADSGRNREQRGVGLGLAIVQALAEAHGGCVTAESSGLGQGSTFTLHLPL